ncbi:MAG: hypothetical protein ACTSUE_22075 [Promethearchaeota archaeon]
MDSDDLSKELKRELLDAFNLPTKGLKRRENTIMTRISHDDLQIMNALVELGIFKSISETAAFLIHDSIMSKNNYYNRILKIFKEIKAKKLEAVATLLESVKEEREEREAMRNARLMLDLPDGGGDRGRDSGSSSVSDSNGSDSSGSSSVVADRVPRAGDAGGSDE